MHLTSRDRLLGQQLRQLSSKYNNRYGPAASAALLRILYRQLADHNDDFLRCFFPGDAGLTETEPWRLSEAQGAIDGAEYSASARGRRCGHIFKNGEATYSCRTCTADDTCVLCTRCFEASDHEGHQVYVTTSGGSSGCCDCEDPEAWIRPVKCSIHTPLVTEPAKESSSTRRSSTLPPELQESIRTTISRAFDFLCDTLSCCPEDMKPPSSERHIRQEEEKSRLAEKLYGVPEQREKEFALVLWNDEKHTVDEVAVQVARACRKPRSFGNAKALEVDRVGRSILFYSYNLEELLQQARILAQIKVTVTIRSSRDTFREEMCGTIIEWLSDIAGCSVGSDPNILMDVICEEMLKPWRIGSEAFNLEVAKYGIMDHQKSDERLERLRQANRLAQLQQLQQTPRGLVIVREPIMDLDVEEGDDIDEDDDALDTILQNAANETEEASNDDAGDGVDGDDDRMDLDEPFTGQNDDGEVEIDTTAGHAEVLESIGVLGLAPLTAHQQDQTSEMSEDEIPTLVSQSDTNKLFNEIPITPKQKLSPGAKAPKHWVKRRNALLDNEDRLSHLPYEDLSRRIRIDHLIMYELRLWKQLRTHLKHLYISTVVTIPAFKRILSLRFAALYTHLAQLYLVADREPDHSIINLSLQMLTTPSITAEAVKRGNFLTRLLAILYTFLTKRQVGNPEDVDVTAMMAFEAGIMTNRRIYHFFSDMKYLLDAPYVRDRIRHEPEYLLQFLDFAKLYQGICPNVRAVGEHIEYESDSWITASMIVRDVTRMSRQFCDSFKWTKSQDPEGICRAIRQTAKVTIINSLGVERARFTQSELKQETCFKRISFGNNGTLGQPAVYSVVDFQVEKGSLSFHHALHYTLSWLIDCGKSMSRDQLHLMLTFTPNQLQSPELRSSSDVEIGQLSAQEYLLALFDIPLRVCAWLGQMKAGMWVRNGITLRHQMGTYRGVGQRDVSHQRDLFLLQVAFAVCEPEAFLAATIDRFGMSQWMNGNFAIQEGFEDYQLVDMAEDFIHLLIVLLSDRTLLLPTEEDPNPILTSTKRDIIHVLCFKPLTYSELTARLSDKVQELNNLHEILQEVASFRAPEGLADSGQLQLKQEYCRYIDPYHAYYSKSQREEAENIYRTYVAKRSGKLMEDVFFVPELHSIKTGIFSTFATFTQTPLFVHIISQCLSYVLIAEKHTPNIASGRAEAFLQAILHLALIAILEDQINTDLPPQNSTLSFTDTAICGNTNDNIETRQIILVQLILLAKTERYRASEYRIRFLLNHMHEKRPEAFQAQLLQQGLLNQWLTLMRTSQSGVADNVALKKQQALQRQAKVMEAFKQQQHDFLQNQPIDWGLDESDGAENDMDETMQSESWNFPAGTCIFCQEETRDQQLYGTLGYITESNIFRQTDLQDEKFIEEVCTVPSQLDRSADSIRPFGVVGANMSQTTKVNAPGNTVMAARKGLGMGFPSSQHQTGAVVTGCGHLMHYSCFQTYDEATMRRHQYQVARTHPEDEKFKEFVCPLCKALGNSFLPIVWKAKHVVDMVGSHSSHFTEWLATQLGNPEDGHSANSCDQTGVAAAPTILETSETYFQQYIMNAFNGSLASALGTDQRPRIHGVPEAQTTSSSRFRVPAFLRFDQRGGSNLERVTNEQPPRSVLVAELEKAYQRLLETIRLNRLHSTSSNNSVTGELSHADVLASSLGCSIAAVELSQRGVEPNTGIFPEGIPEQAITHLKVLSETISSYIALGGFRPWTRNSPKFQLASRLQARVLFGHDDPYEEDRSSRVTPLLAQDLFSFYTQCTVFMVPAFGLEALHVLHLCYFAEVVKVIVAFIQEPDATWNLAKSQSIDERYSCTPTVSQQFSTFVEDILFQCRKAASYGGAELPRLWADTDSNTRYGFDRLLYHLLSKYALIFLRKSALLLHVRYGLKFAEQPLVADYQSITSASTPEISRLSLLLGLPTLEEMVGAALQPGSQSSLLLHLSASWIRSWSLASRHCLLDTQKANMSISTSLRLAHPSIYELVALPYAHDTLNAEALSRRCPSTGGELSDPSICLFCGAFVCSQSRCCTVLDPITRRQEGGCFQHRKACGGSIGMFLNIRRCAVLCLYEDRGSFFTAPYLDKHGEVDMGLRRKNQLFLNQRRYDRLFRDMWLNHQIPSAVARKLEAEINTGGWESV